MKKMKKHKVKGKLPTDFLQEIVGKPAREGLCILEAAIATLEEQGFTDITFEDDGEWEYNTLHLHYKREETKPEKATREEKARRAQLREEYKVEVEKLKVKYGIGGREPGEGMKDDDR